MPNYYTSENVSTGLKILRSERVVPVRFRSRAPLKLNYSIGLGCGFLAQTSAILNRVFKLGDSTVTVLAHAFS